MNKSPAVVAAIPTWNMAEQTLALIPSLQKQNYDLIAILDDNSTDHTSERIHEIFGDTVHVVKGETNLGAAGNRNRILGLLGELGMNSETIINFIDADTELLPDSKTIPEQARELFKAYPDAGIIAGKVLNADGSWCAFNYGPRFSWRFLPATLTQLRIEQLSKHDPEKAAQAYKQHAKLLAGFPNPYKTPKARVVSQVLEVFTFVQAGTFARVGGYDPTLRYCESLDYGAKLAKLGLQAIFDPRVGVRHLQVDVRGKRRNVEIVAATARIAGRYATGRYRPDTSMNAK